MRNTYIKKKNVGKILQDSLGYSIWSKEPPPPRGGFLFTMFPDQEPCVRDFTTRCDGRISLWNLLHTALDQGTTQQRNPPGGWGFLRSNLPRVSWSLLENLLHCVAVCCSVLHWNMHIEKESLGESLRHLKPRVQQIRWVASYSICDVKYVYRKRVSWRNFPRLSWLLNLPWVSWSLGESLRHLKPRVQQTRWVESYSICDVWNTYTAKESLGEILQKSAYYSICDVKYV